MNKINISPDRVDRYVREGDAFLLSCLKYAAFRKAAAEKEIHRLTDEVNALRDGFGTSAKEIRHHKTFTVLHDKIKSLLERNDSIRKDRDYYMSVCNALRNPKVVTLDEIQERDFSQAEVLGDMLLRLSAEKKDGKAVSVMVDSFDDRVSPVYGICYDPDKHCIRIQTDFGYVASNGASDSEKYYDQNACYEDLKKVFSEMTAVYSPETIESAMAKITDTI